MQLNRILDMKLCVSTAAMMMVFSLGCQGPVGPEGPSADAGGLDKQIRIDFANPTVTTSHTFPYENYGSIYRFNVQHYRDIDSVVFAAELFVTDNGGEAVAQLVDRSSSVVLAELTSSSTSRAYVESANLLFALPPEEATLDVRMRSSQYGVTAGISGATLLLYRK